MELKMHVSCESDSGLHKELDFSINTSSAEEWSFLKHLLSENKDIRDDWSLLHNHHYTLYRIICQKADDMLEGACGNDKYKNRKISWNKELLEAANSETAKVSDDDSALLYEEIGGVLITDKNLIGFHYRKHYMYDPTPRRVGEIDYPTCDTMDCDIFGQDEERWHKGAHYSEAWCGVTPDCVYLTIEFFNGDRVQMVSMREEQRCFETRLRCWPQYGSLYDCAKRMRRVIRIKRRNQPNADPKEIVRIIFEVPR